MSVPNFMSKAFSYQDSGRGHYVPPSRGMIRQKDLGTDTVKIQDEKIRKMYKKTPVSGHRFS